MRARATVLLTLAIILAGCASTKQHSAPTTSLSPTAVPTSTSTPPAMSATSSTIAVATTSSTVAPTTTLPVEDQVRMAAKAAYVYYWQCLAKPAECDPGVIDVPGSDAFLAFTKTTHDLVAGGFFFGDPAPGYMAIESVETKADHTLVTSCWWITAVFYGPPATAGGPPVVQSDRAGWTRQADQYVQMPDGSWKKRRGDTLTTKTGANECPPA